ASCSTRSAGSRPTMVFLGGAPAAYRCKGSAGRSWSSLVFVGRKKEVSGVFDALGLEPSELFGQVVGYEGLAGCDSVDAAYLLNGLFQKLLGAVGPECR